MRALAALAALAFAQTLAYGWYLGPEWEPFRSDQFEYLALARALVERGEFTRAQAGEMFLAEWLRTPGYPLLIAPLCAGGCDHWRIAAAQGVLYAAMVPLTFAVARRIDPRIALASAAAVAIYLPFGYFAALPLSDLPATFLLLLAAVTFFETRERRSVAHGLAFGAACALLALTRSLFLLAPLAFVLGGWASQRGGLLAARRPWLAGAFAFLAIVAPPALHAGAVGGTPITGSGGLVLWYGALQGKSELDAFEAREADAMWRSIERVGRLPSQTAKAEAWPELDSEFRTRGARLIAHDPVGWAWRGLTVRTPVLWTRDEPIRTRDAASAPLVVPAVFMAAQLVIAALAVTGLVASWRAGRRDAAVIGAVLALVWIGSFPFQTEARYALPAKPFLLIAAVAGVTAIRPRL